MAKEKKEQRYYNGIAIDSDEEMMMIMYIEELIAAGFILKLERAETFVLTEGLQKLYTKTVEMKTKTKTVDKSQNVLEEHVYTPEFRIIWNYDVPEKLCNSLVPGQKFEAQFMCAHDTRMGSTVTEKVSYIEVKPEHDRHNMTRLFVINRKWMWEKFHIFINLCQPQSLFEKTFTPAAWLLTPTGKKRVIHWDIRTLNEYLETIK